MQCRSLWKCQKLLQFFSRLFAASSLYGLMFALLGTDSGLMHFMSYAFIFSSAEFQARFTESVNVFSNLFRVSSTADLCLRCFLWLRCWKNCQFVCNSWDSSWEGEVSSKVRSNQRPDAHFFAILLAFSDLANWSYAESTSRWLSKHSFL